MINSKNIDIFLRGVRADFAMVQDQAEKQLTALNTDVYLDATSKTGALFEDKNATGVERVEVVGVTGVSELSPIEENQEYPDTDYVPTFITAVEPYTFAKRIKVSRRSAERRDSKYQKALNESSKLQIAAENTKARHRFQRFNTAFAAVTLPQLFDYNDGVALVSASHPTKVPGGSPYSNIVTASDITTTSIESMLLVLQNQIDDIGEPMPMGGGMNYFICPKAKVRTAKEKLESEWIPDSANNNINVWKSVAWKLVSSPFLSAKNGGSDTAHFIVDGMYSPIKDYIFRGVTNETWFDENVKVFVHDISFEHKVGAVDYRGIVGNAGK